VNFQYRYAARFYYYYYSIEVFGLNDSSTWGYDWGPVVLDHVGIMKDSFNYKREYSVILL